MATVDAPVKHWADIQQATFTRWCNDYLSERGIYINDLFTDLRDGKALIALLEVLGGESLGRHNKHPRVKVQQVENLSIALKYIASKGVKMVNISGEDVHEGNARIILGLIWSLILFFEIQRGNLEGGGVDDLLRWVQSKIPDYNITGWNKDWNDGRAVNALVNALRPELCKDHKDLDPSKKVENAKKGIDTAEREMGVDRLIFPEEMANPRVPKLAMQTYIAQFRNLKPVSGASRCQAYGPGLQEGVANTAGRFRVLVPDDVEGKLEVKVEGPDNDAEVELKKGADGIYDVSYTPNIPGSWKVHVTVGGEHVPGSIFHVQVLAEISLGGEGKIRVYYSTTSSSQKARDDFTKLTRLLEARKVHLREDFEPWVAVDLMSKPDRDAVFEKAGTRKLPIVFIDDKYTGDYDAMERLNEENKLTELLAMKGKALVSEEEHLARLKQKE